MLDGYIDELATYQCSCAPKELSDVQTTLLRAIVDTAESFVTIIAKSRSAAAARAHMTRLLHSCYDLNSLDTV